MSIFEQCDYKPKSGIFPRSSPSAVFSLLQINHRTSLFARALLLVSQCHPDGRPMTPTYACNGSQSAFFLANVTESDKLFELQAVEIFRVERFKHGLGLVR